MKALSPILYKEIIENAIKEDFWPAGDLTTNFFVPQGIEKCATINSRQNGILAGIDASLYAFRYLNQNLQIEKHIDDGARIEVGQKIATIQGDARSILSAERTALNILSHLSGIATMTGKMVDAVKGTEAKITDTRKTLPGLRAIQKYAVRCGGGVNHRFGLYDAVMVKDNHLMSYASWEDGIKALREELGHTIKIEVEVDNLEQLQKIIALPVDIVLLDNMDLETLKIAVKMVDGRMITEASGNVNVDTVGFIAKTGVDVISSGALTHSVKAHDFGLDFDQ